MRKFSILSLFALLLLPFFTFAQSNNLVLLGTDIQCSGADCGFDNLLLLAQAIITFIIKLSIPVAAGLFIYAGFLWVTAASSEGQVTKAKGIFTTAFWGFVIILGAWLIVYTLVTAIVDPKYLGEGGFLRFLNTN